MTDTATPPPNRPPERRRRQGMTVVEVVTAVGIASIVLLAAVATLNLTVRTSAREGELSDGKTSLQRITQSMTAQTSARSFLALDTNTDTRANLVFIAPERAVRVLGATPSTGGMTLQLDKTAQVLRADEPLILLTGAGEAVRVLLKNGAASIGPDSVDVTNPNCAYYPEITDTARLYPASTFTLDYLAAPSGAQAGQTLYQAFNGGSPAVAAFDLASYKMTYLYDSPAGNLSKAGQDAPLQNVIYSGQTKYTLSSITLQTTSARGLSTSSYSAELPLPSAADVGLKRFNQCNNGTTPLTNTDIRGSSMYVRVTGLPAGTPGNYAVDGPDAADAPDTWNQSGLSASASRSNLRPGTYVTTINEVTDHDLETIGGTTYDATRTWRVGDLSTANVAKTVQLTSWNSPIVEADYRALPGRLQIRVNRAPDSAPVRIYGPIGSNAFNNNAAGLPVTFREKGQFRNFPPGVYRVEARSFGSCSAAGQSGCYDVSPNPLNQYVALSSGATATITINYTYRPPPPPTCQNPDSMNPGGPLPCVPKCMDPKASNYLQEAPCQPETGECTPPQYQIGTTSTTNEVCVPNDPSDPSQGETCGMVTTTTPVCKTPDPKPPAPDCTQCTMSAFDYRSGCGYKQVQYYCGGGFTKPGCPALPSPNLGGTASCSQHPCCTADDNTVDNPFFGPGGTPSPVPPPDFIP